MKSIWLLLGCGCCPVSGRQNHDLAGDFNSWVVEIKRILRPENLKVFIKSRNSLVRQPLSSLRCAAVTRDLILTGALKGPAWAADFIRKGSVHLLCASPVSVV